MLTLSSDNLLDTFILIDIDDILPLCITCKSFKECCYHESYWKLKFNNDNIQIIGLDNLNKDEHHLSLSLRKLITPNHWISEYKYVKEASSFAMKTIDIVQNKPACSIISPPTILINISCFQSL